MERGVVDRGREDESRAVDPWFDGIWFAGTASDHEAVIEHAVLPGTDPGNERRVVGPGDGGIDDGHRAGHGTPGGEPAQMGHRDRLVAPEIGGEAVDADEHDVAVRVGGEGRGPEEAEQRGESESTQGEAGGEEHGEFIWRPDGRAIDGARRRP